MNRYRFSTKPIESGSGLAYYGYRYYDPGSGRWPSRDPIGERGGINLSAFATNNLIDHYDELGLFPWISDGINWVVDELEESCDNIRSQGMCIACCGGVSGVSGILGMAETMSGLSAVAAGLGSEIVTGGGSSALSVPAIIGGCLVAGDGINHIVSEVPDSFEECRSNCMNNF